MSALPSTVLAAALALLAAAVPGTWSVPASPALAPVDAMPPAAPVVVIGLTDRSGLRTDVAVDGLDAVPSAEPAAGRAGLAVVPAVWPGDGARAVTAQEHAADGIAVLTEPVATPDFLVAGVTWAAGDALPPGARIWLRVLEDGTWSGWLELEAEDSGVDGTPGTDPFVTGGAEAVQVQVSGDPAALPASLALTLVPAHPSDETQSITETPDEAVPVPGGDAVAEPADAAETVAPTAGAGVVAASYAVRSVPAAGAPAALPGAVARPTITSRAQWGADASLATWAPTYAPLRAAVVHHTAGTNSYSASQSPSIVRGIFYYHAVTRGWGDIGYNFLVDKYGQVFEGRRGSLAAPSSSMTVGAHASGFNTGTVGLSAMGDYTQVDAPQVILDRMADVIAWRFSLAGISMSTSSGLVSPGTAYRSAGQSLPRVFAHRDVGQTTCPGNDIYGRIASLRTAVTNRLAGAGPAASPTPTPTPTVDTRANPVGNLEDVWAVPGGIRVKGWTFDPDAPTDPIYVWVTVDGDGEHQRADQTRPDVGTAYPAAGSAHGFDGVRTVAAGKHTVCATASNVGAGAHTSLGCRTVTVLAGSPIGEVAYVRPATGEAQVSGWVIDPDTTGLVYVWMTVDGVGRHVAANLPLTEVGEQHPGYGDAHGFATTVPLAAGLHTICLTASNVGAGSHTPFGCTELRVLDDPNPLGALARVEAVPGGVAVEGWTFDPDTTAPAFVWVTVNGKGQHVLADATRDDVAALYPGYGSRHGLRRTLPVGPGTRTVCLTTSNVGGGAHLPLGCRTVTVRAGSPIGHSDSVTAVDGAVRIAGWTLDPDTTSSIYVWVTVDGQGRHVRADRFRNDLARAFPGYGGSHGYAADLPAPPGAHRVCLTASNVGSGGHTALGCRTVTVPTPEPAPVP